MELHQLTATQAIEAFKKREVSPVELVDALLARIDRYDSKIEAWESLDREGSRAAAQQAEAAYRDGTAAPFAGVPVGMKDIFAVKGLPNTANFAPFANNVSTEDSGAAQRLRAAGAVLLGKTVTVQFAWGTDSPKTRNPWNLERTPGGSSSGSGAAVGARMVPVALGTQTGGSNLRPAAYNGAVGLKPSLGRISRYQLIPVSWSLDHPGIICRSVEDAALTLSVVAGHDPRDPHTVKAPLGNLVAAAQTVGRPPRLGLLTDLLEQAQPAVRANAEATAKRLQDAGAEVREVRLPGKGRPFLLAVHYTIITTEGAAVHARLHKQHPDSYRPGVRANIEIGSLLPSAGYVHAQRLRRELRAQMDELVGSVDALLAPTTPNTVPNRSTTGDASFQAIFTLFGLPNLTLPSGLNDEGLPFAVQLVASRYAEERLIRTARWAESVLEPIGEPSLP